MKNYKDLIANIAFIATILMIVFGARLFWAKAVYGDIRCVFAECRIQVNP